MRAVFRSYPSGLSPPSKEGECESYEDQAGLVGFSGEVVNIVDMDFVGCAIIARRRTKPKASPPSRKPKTKADETGSGRRNKVVA